MSSTSIAADYPIGLIQLISTGFVAVAFGVIWVVEYFFPEFFNFPYLALNLDALLYYWPLFLFNIFYIFATSTLSENAVYQEGSLLANLATGMYAGVWEELGYRCAFICIAMLSIVLWDFLIAQGVGYLAVVGGGVLIYMGYTEGNPIKLVVGAVLIPLGIWWVSGVPDMRSWFYEVVVVPVVDFLTLGLMSNVLKGDYPALFIFGGVLANFWFRDGHEYQGIVGWIRSWFMGMVFLYTMIVYGLWTAMLLHSLSNAQKILMMWMFYRR